MRISVASLLFCGAILANNVFAEETDAQRQARSGSHKPDSDGTWTKPPIHDVCERQYPLGPSGPQQIPYAFKRYKISPELTPPPPQIIGVKKTLIGRVIKELKDCEHFSFIQVTYDDLHSCQPNLGNEVNVCGLSKPPKLSGHCEKGKLYTVLLINQYYFGEVNHLLLSPYIKWWIVDVPGCNLEDATTIIEYQQPLPQYGTGKQKYVFLAYEQPDYEIDWSDEPLVSSKYVLAFFLTFSR